MRRRLSACLAVAALAATSALVATDAQAATHRQPVPQAGGRAAAKAGSVAFFGAQGAFFQAVKGVTGRKAHRTAFFDVSGTRAIATAVNPVGGDDGLLCDTAENVAPVRTIRTSVQLDPVIDASEFGDEGGDGFHFECSGVAVHGTFGLATGDSQGLVQLRRQHGAWKIDRRVHSPGLNDAGDPHRPGWINFRDSVTTATTFDNVAIAPKPMPNGKYLGIAVDHSSRTVAVVAGVGSAKPRLVGALHDASLGNPALDQGTGGVVFLPGSSDRALIATMTGFAVLRLRDPAEPRLAVRTKVGDASLPPTSITVSSDADHVAVSAGGRVFGYRNVRAAVRDGKKFRKQTSFRLGSTDTESVTDVAYTANDTLVVLHGDSASSPDWFLTLVTKVPHGHHAVHGSTSTTQPSGPGSLSVWPAP
jgi:hypothetical protein